MVREKDREKEREGEWGERGMEDERVTGGGGRCGGGGRDTEREIEK